MFPCPSCKRTDKIITEGMSIHPPDYVRWRKNCLACEIRFHTTETLEGSKSEPDKKSQNLINSIPQFAGDRNIRHEITDPDNQDGRCCSACGRVARVFLARQDDQFHRLCPKCIHTKEGFEDFMFEVNREEFKRFFLYRNREPFQIMPLVHKLILSNNNVPFIHTELGEKGFTLRKFDRVHKINGEPEYAHRKHEELVKHHNYALVDVRYPEAAIISTHPGFKEAHEAKNFLYA